MTGHSCIPRSYGTLDAARAVLRRQFGYPDFRPPQLRAVQTVVEGHDALIVLPTGGGKSLCFQVPALLREGLTIVISPLISLMKDQVDALQRRGVAAAYINSTLHFNEVSSRLARARDGSLRLLYLAPERLDAGHTLHRLSASGVSLLVIDEAHCISEWGHDFRPSYRRIGVIRDRLGSPQTVALTATATPLVRNDIVRQLALRRAKVIVGGFDRVNLTYLVAATHTPPDKDKAAVQWLRREDGAAIVYAPTRSAVERVTSVLVRARVRAVSYHAGLDHRVRQRAQEAFMVGRTRVIVATSAFGMGIDKADVRLVVHHAMPASLEAYYQEAGRAGRDGAPSTCVLLHRHPDRFTHEFFLAHAHPDRRLIEQAWHVLRQLADRDHVVGLSLEQLTKRICASADARTTAAVLRVLRAAGAVCTEPAAAGRAWVRLLAAPERITQELRGERDTDRELLRALWRAVGRCLEHGASVDLDALPPEFGGSRRVLGMLDRLQAEQYVTWSRIGGGFRLATRSLDPTWLPVDWTSLERRRQADLDRLNAMEQYSQTRACRRAFVLRYFGDTDARQQCGACDRCIGFPTHTPRVAPWAWARAVSFLSHSNPPHGR